MTKFAEWGVWIDWIRPDIQELRISRHVYQEIVRMVEQNAHIQQHSTFYSWIHSNYHDRVVMALRRHVDTRSDSLGLMRVLMSIQSDVRCLSRQNFVSLWGPSLSAIANAEFDKHAGAHQSFLPAQVVGNDLAALEASLAQARRYSNHNIAHYSEQPMQPPTVGELDSACETLENTYQKYKMLLTAEVPDLLPRWQYDWKRIFRTAWLP